MDPELLERITARRAELDELEEQLAKQLAEVRAERDELAVAERVLERVSEQLADERASAAPMPGQVGGRSVMLIPHREPGLEETMLPPDYQRILAAVRQAAGPVMARHVGEMRSSGRRGQVGVLRAPFGEASWRRLPARMPSPDCFVVWASAAAASLGHGWRLGVLA
ncbi:hypothetical protein ACFY1J_45920 [Streptomyces sp. NPDC001406]|uniref:hypothetical protein n=1 Tax=Streptomyces sp. NPDC001406 TaxID=3364572 RepID=UPI0036B1CE4C